jgi:glutaredoxin-dependent peroxiredoxin
MPIAVGSPAPDFTLKSKTADGLRDVKLSENFGRRPTVVLFFPAAFSGVCTKACRSRSGCVLESSLLRNQCDGKRP